MRCWLAVSSGILLALAAHGQVKVIDSEDVVRLVSGEEIRGQVLGAGLKAVVIVVKNEDDEIVEKTIPREQIEKVTRGEPGAIVRSYDTETVLGMKVVTGESEGEEEDDSPGAGDKRKPAKPAAKGGKKRPGGGKAPGGNAIPKINKQQLENLMKGNPGIERMVKAAGGPDKALALLKQRAGNPQMAKFLQQFLKSGKLPALLQNR